MKNSAGELSALSAQISPFKPGEPQAERQEQGGGGVFVLLVS